MLVTLCCVTLECVLQCMLFSDSKLNKIPAFLSEEQGTAITESSQNINDGDAIISSIGLDLC